jgi:membrane protein
MHVLNECLASPASSPALSEELLLFALSAISRSPCVVYIRGGLLCASDVYIQMSGKQAFSFLKRTYTQWSDRQAPRLGASVAFYSILSFAPLLVLITAVIALVFGHESAQGALVNEARQVIGDRGADTVQTLLKNAQKPASGVFASIVAFITLLFGASGVFTELQDALNVMWDVKPKTGSGFMGTIRQRLFSFGMVLSIGFLLLVSLLLSAGLAYLGRSLGHFLPMPPVILQAINFVVSFVAVAVLFALMFKYVPAVKISWRNVFIGAVGTALLFTIGKQLLGLYLGKASVGSTYGAAGSLVAVVVWIYYSAQIFFFGAEFTRVYAEAHGMKKQAPAEQQTVEARSESQVTQRPTGHKTEPIRVAAGLTSAAPLRLPEENAPARVSAATHPASGEQVTVTERSELLKTPSLSVTARPAAEGGRKPKRKLLMAAAVGFVLGRVFGDTHRVKS